MHAQITSILVGSKFIKVNLSVYDNDGMEGFYVPESAFRDMVKEASAQAIQQNMQLGNNTNSTLSGESVALQALQSIYQQLVPFLPIFEKIKLGLNITRLYIL